MSSTRSARRRRPGRRSGRGRAAAAASGSEDQDTGERDRAATGMGFMRANASNEDAKFIIADALRPTCITRAADCAVARCVWLDCDRAARIAAVAQSIWRNRMSTIESVLHETRVFEPPREFVAQANVKKADYDAMCARPRATSRASGRGSRASTCSWQKPFTKTLDESNAPFYKWFDDGELNVSYNCLDRNLENGNADKVAIIFEADDGKVTKITYRELLPARLPLRQRRSSRSASRRATACSSTCRCRSRAWSRCRPARASAPRIRSCSAAFRRSRCRSASSTPARSR